MRKLEIKTLSSKSTKGFSILAGINRAINPSQVTKMANSIEKMGIIRPIVVAKMDFLTGSEETYIIDGQHLFTALLRTGDDFPYTEIIIRDKAELVEKIALLNNSSKSWSMKDYILAWSSIRPEYIKLNHYFKVYDIELSQLAQILLECKTRYNIGGTYISGILKRGEFEIPDEVESVKILDYITDALKIIHRMDRMSNKMFISFFVNYITSVPYNHASYMTRLAANRDKFKLITLDPEEYRKIFKSI